MGDYDLIKVVLDRIADMRWMQIAIKPAKPFAFGASPPATGSVPVFGLPGNPVSSLVSFEVLARPALRQMMGHAGHRPPARCGPSPTRACPAAPTASSTSCARTAASSADGRWHVRSTGAQGSHQLAATAAADGLALVPDGDGVAPAATSTSCLIGW